MRWASGVIEEGEEKGGSDWQVGVQVGRVVGEKLLDQKRKKGWAIALGLGLGQKMEVESGPIWAEIRPRLKEMGLAGAMGEIGNGHLQFRFRTLFDVLALTFFTNIFPQKIDLNIFPSIYRTAFRSKPKQYGEFFNQCFL